MRSKNEQNGHLRFNIALLEKNALYYCNTALGLALLRAEIQHGCIFKL